jgi:hypothetical protein
MKTKEQRQQAVKQIEDSFLIAMKGNGIELSDDAVCRIGRCVIVLGISAIGKYAEKGFQMAFASDVTLYACDESDFGGGENKINFGCSGSFTPNERESYWRTIHAASILKNWKTVSEIVNTHCKMYSDLCERIFEVNS